MKKQTNYKPVAPVLHPNANVSLKEQIAQRAHELWLYRGHKHGNDLADWFQAEHEIKEWHQHRAQASPASAHTSLRYERDLKLLKLSLDPDLKSPAALDDHPHR